MKHKKCSFITPMFFCNENAPYFQVIYQVHFHVNTGSPTQPTMQCFTHLIHLNPHCCITKLHKHFTSNKRKKKSSFLSSIFRKQLQIYFFLNNSYCFLDHSPLFPPLLCSRRTSVIWMSFEAALHISYTVSPAMVTAVIASISTPVFPVDAASPSISTLKSLLFSFRSIQHGR